MIHRAIQHLADRPAQLSRVLVALVGAGLLFWYSPMALLYLLSLYFCYVYLGQKFSSLFINSKFLLFVGAFFTHAGAFCLLAIICSVFAGVHFYVVLAAELLFFLLLRFLGTRSKQKPVESRATITKQDWLSLLVAFAAVALMAAVPLANTNSYQQRSNTLVLVTGNVDYGAHLAFFNDYLDSNTVRLWGDGDLHRSDGGAFYPSSWHAANAALTHAAAPSVTPGTSSLIALGLLNIFWIGLLVFLWSRLSFILYSFLSVAGRSVLSYGAMTLGLSVGVYFFVVHLMRFGFFTFTPQLIAALLLVFCLLQLLREGVGSRSTVGLALLYCSISLATWILLLPAVLGATIVVAAIAITRLKPKKIHAIQDVKSNWPLYIVVLASAISQLWLMSSVETTTSVGLMEGLMLDGGVPIYDTLIYGILVLGLMATARAQSTSSRKLQLYEPLLILAGVTILFTGLLFILQTYATSAVHYYYYKALLLVPFVLAPLAIAALGLYIGKCMVKDRAIALLVALFLPIFILQIVPSDKSVSSFIRGSRSVSSHVNEAVYEEIRTSPYPEKHVTIYFVGTNESSDTASLLVQANRPHSTCFTDLRQQIMYKRTDKAVSDLEQNWLPESCAGYTVSYKIGKQYASLLQVNHVTKYTVEVIND